MQKTLLAVITTIALCVTTITFGHSGATGIVKERMDSMKELGKQSKLVTKMFKGQSTFDKTEVIDAADLFIQHGEKMLSLFPDTEQSRQGKMTEALPKIWKDWDGFTAEVDEFIDRSEVLQQTAASTDDQKVLRKAFMQATKSCSSCHKAYRKPKR